MQAAGYQAVDLAYHGEDLSMLFLLPDQKDGLRDLEKRLSARMLHDCVAQLGAREVMLSLPRFKITRGPVDLRGPMIALGMPLAFARFQANFSGINGRKPPDEDSLFISSVFHRAFTAVNEDGTEAGVDTAEVGYASKSISPDPVFQADHPFLFALRDRKSGVILFLGRVADPTQER